MFEAASALFGIAVLFGIPIWAATGLRTSRRNRIALAVGGVILTAAWLLLIFWLATR